MVHRACVRCKAQATFSLSFLLSTLGRTPRLQKCTTSAAFCLGCLQAICASLARAGLPSLTEPLSEAYTAFACNLAERSDPRSASSPERPEN
jgi:hypothetical protein